ncbi:polysaccharide deacetylase family protein [Paenibacillus oceani]|uniref:Polysaccharide deacetylase family protein n=1 Tax=Paenibacillus oceani TaxID=2772510 RepID=A0A927H0L4_9BACL|nr:polysaccharide deacetylase family protein [Paenibacillus oceani]MBD2863810.1 polysaccharide deacetylase family protein [Paenibacillus oceani]
MNRTKLLIRTLIFFVAGIALLMPVLGVSKGKTMYAEQVAVLMYHHIYNEDESSGTITTDLFEEQLVYLREHGYTFISLQQFLAFMEGAAVPDNAVLVTFDDGYESVYANAYPILTRMGIPAANFIITNKHDNPREHTPTFMTPDEIRTMTTAMPGIISAQCHTEGMHDNPDAPFMVTRLPTPDGGKETEEQYRQRIVSDTRACIQRLTPLGPEKVNTLAYPYGVYDKISSELLREAGIEYAFTIVPEMATRSVNKMQIPRINAGSPHISPEVLHQTIQRRIETVIR